MADLYFVLFQFRLRRRSRRTAEIYVKQPAYQTLNHQRLEEKWISNVPLRASNELNRDPDGLYRRMRKPPHHKVAVRFYVSRGRQKCDQGPK